MLGKRISILFSISVLFLCALGVSAQTGPVRGVVKMKQADGTTVPVVGALVEPYRIDTDQGKGPTAKTDKSGGFVFAGLPVANKYVLSVSGAGISPAVSGTVRAGMENVEMIVNAGDGKQYTEAEIRKIVKDVPEGGASMSDAEQKRIQAEYEKDKAKYEESKKKADDANKITAASYKDGDAAYKAKDYALAISKFEEGIAADPNFEGSAPVLLNYKAVAHKDRGRTLIVEAQKSDAATRAAALEKATVDYNAAIAALDRGLKVIEAAPADSNVKDSLVISKRIIFNNYVVVLGEMYETFVPVPSTVDARKVLATFLELEVDAKKKVDATRSLAERSLKGGELELSLVAYQKVLESSPNDVDALSGIAIAYTALGFSSAPPNKEQLQLAINYAQAYMDSAPKDHKNQAAVVDVIDNIKTQVKLTPQKLAPKKP